MISTTPPRHRPPQLPPSSLRNKPTTSRRISNPMAYSTITPSKSRTPPPPPIQTFQSPPNTNESHEVADQQTDIYEGYLQPSDDTSYNNNSNDDLIPLTTVWPSLLSSTFSEDEEDTNNILECNYDINPTILYQNIQSKQWSSVIQRSQTHPNEVSTWVSRTEVNSNKLRWKLLPLHAAIIFHAPYDVIKCLCDVDSTNNKYGYSVQSCDDQGKLPLHLCLRKNNTPDDNSMTNFEEKLKVIELLINIYPESLSIKDNKGRTPIRLVHKLSNYEQDLYMNLFDNINMKDEDIEESAEKENDMRGIITVQTGDDIPSISTSHIPWMPRRLPPPQTKQQLQSRMDDELLQKLHHRRNKEAEYELKKSQENLEDHEEGMEIVYNVDTMPIKSTVNDNVLPPPPPPPGPPPPPPVVHLKKDIPEEKEDTDNDVKLLQKFHTQRVKKEDPPETRDLSIDNAQSATPNNKYKNKIDNDIRAQSKSKSFINISGKMNKDPRISAMRERLRSRIKTESTENSMPNDNKEKKKQSTYTASKKKVEDTKQQEPRGKDEDENITVTSSICSSTTGSIVPPYKYFNTPDPPVEQEEHDSGVESLSVNSSKQDMNKNDIIRDSNSKKLDGYHEDSMKDMLQALTKSFSLNDEYSVDQLDGKSIEKDTYGKTKQLDLYTSNTLITAPTDDMTEEEALLPNKYQSSSHSPSEVYTSLVYKVNTKDETTDGANKEETDDSLDTPKLLMRLNKLKSQRFFTSPEGTNNNDIMNDLATPNLMMQADKFFSSTPRKDEEEVVENEREKVEEDTSVASSITHTKFDKIMAKYAIESDQEKLASESSKDKPVDNREEILHMEPKFRRSDSKRDEVQSFRSRLNKQQASEYNTPSYLTSTDSYQNNIKSISFRKIAPVNSMDSDAVSTLSKNTGITTLGPISIATDDSSVIESYVQSIVEQVLSKEVESAGTMKRELESALRSKMKLGRKVKNLLKARDDQSLELKRAIESKHIQQDKFQREMEIHLTRKASELHEAMKQALNQAEESKTRALQLAEREMGNEVSLLRRQIKDLQSQNNEVHIDRSLHNALELVETNQQALRQAAEKDVLSSLQMKEEIEQSFISAVGQFEKWTDKQLELMEEKWRGLR